MTRGVELVGNDETRIDLLEWPYKLGASPGLWGMPPVATLATPAPGRAGSYYRASKFLERPVQVPIIVQASSALELDEKLARLAQLVNPNRGPCRLVVFRSDGTSRELVVRYSSGFEAIPIRDSTHVRAAVPLVFVAHEPFWRSVEEHEVTFEQTAFNESATPTGYADDIPYDAAIPYEGVGAAGVAFLPIRVNGDETSWPRFEITGPGTMIEFAKVSPPNRVWRWEGTLAAGEVLVVDTEPGRRSVRVNDTPAFADMSVESMLWGLDQGSNTVAVRVLGYEAGVTTVKIVTRDLWLTA